jgi:hypothetical protein
MANKRTLFLLMAMLIMPWVAFSQNTIIYQQDFESCTPMMLPSGWIKIFPETNPAVGTNPTHNQSTKSLGFANAKAVGNGYSNIVALPDIEVVTGTVTVSFWSKAQKNDSRCGHFDVGYLTDIADASSFVCVRTDDYTGFYSAFTFVTANFSEMPAGSRIAFRHRPTSPTGYCWYIDDVIVTGEPYCCPKPTVAIPIVINGNEASLSWNENGTAQSWILQYGTNPNFVAGTFQTVTQGFVINSNTITANLTNLVPDQTYYARVQSNCTACGETSQWVSFRSFKPNNTVNLTVISGTGSNSYIPFYGCNADLGTRSQFIIPANRLESLADGTITKMTLYANATKTFEGASFQIFMKEVDFTTFETNTFVDWDSMTEVFNGDIDRIGSNWLFEFDEDHRFDYHGGNLLIAFLQTGYTIPGQHECITWSGAGQTANTALYQLANGIHEYSGDEGTLQKFIPSTTFSYFPATYQRPKNLRLSSITPNSVTISWTEPNDNVIAYQYQYRPDSGMSWTETLTTSATSITLTGLQPEQGYTFRVKALYSDGQSEYASKPFITEALCVVPENLVLNDITAHSVTFNWNIVPDAEYQCAVVLESETPDDENYTAIPANNTITGLEVDQDYTLYLRRDCTASGNSYSEPTTQSFHTECIPPTDVYVSYNGGTTAVVTWNGNAESYIIEVNGQVTSGATSPYILHGLDYATTYQVKVKADCGEGVTSISESTFFSTELCSNEDLCVIYYTLTDALSQGNWGYANYQRPNLRVEDHTTGSLIANLSLISGQPTSGIIEVCNGRNIDFVWVPSYNATYFGNSDYRCGYLITDSNGNTICEHVGCNNPSGCIDPSPGLITTYTVNCAPACAKPKDFLASVGSTSATVSWTDSGEASSWEVSYKQASESIYGTSVTVNEKQYTINNLIPGTDYDVLIISGCDPTQTLSGSFTTYCAAVTINDPVTEGFEGWLNDTDTCTYNDINGISPDCWRSYSEGITRPHIINYGDYCHVHSGSCAMYFKGESNTNAYLALPPYSNAANILVSFWMQTDHATMGTLGLGYIIEGDLNFDTYQELETYANNKVAMVQRHTYLGRYTIPSNATHLVFRWQTNGSTYGVCIDDVAIQLVNKVFNGTDNNWHNAANWTPAGMPSIEESVFIQTDATINGAAQAGLIAVGNNATLTLADGGTLMTNNDLIATVKKNITGYGIDNENTNLGYCLIANPVAETYYNDHIQLSPNLTSTNLLDGNYDLYSWDYTSSDGLAWRNYEYLTNQYNGRFNFINGQAYLYANRNDIEVTFTGTARANNVDEEMTTDFGSTQYSFNGWNLIGNPFVCDVYLNDATSADMAFYRMNDGGNGFVSATGAIHPMEGIFVQATAEGQTFKFSRNYIEDNSRGKLNISASEAKRSIVLDNALIRFDEGNTLEKFTFRQGSTKVYIPVEGKDYSVVKAGEVGELPLCFKAAKNGNYTLSFNLESLGLSYLHLIDNMTGADVDLLANPSYSFSAQTTDYASRFRLVFATGSSIDGDSFAFINGMGNLCIFGIEGEATVQVMDALGRMVSSNTFSGSYEQKLNVAPGVYMIRLINGNDVKVQKIVVK